MVGTLVAFATLTTMVIFGVAVAIAHEQSTTSFLGSGNKWCGFGQTAIQPPQGAAAVYSYQPACDALKKKDPGNLRTKTNLLKRNNGVFGQCRTGFWLYNTSRTSSTATLTTWGSSSSPPCGSGRYKVQGFQGIKVSGNWKGGTVRSPGHDW